MDLKEVPAHLIALGGNYLGLEFGQMFRRLGSEVTVVELGDQIIPREDPEVSESLKEALEEEGMSFRLGARTTKVTKTPDGLAVTIEKKDGTTETLKGSHLLVCIGQVPNSDDLGLDRGGHRDRPGRLHSAQRQARDQRAGRVGVGRRQRRGRLHACLV